ncbi:MAG TPA: ABC transporter substrate-binding protein [Acidimicrobiia bacterium]|jgi:polar amino acid transport system substrate-binding protein
MIGRKRVATALVLSLAMLAGACGDDGGGDGATTTAAGGATTTAAGATTTAAAEELPLAGQTVTVGVENAYLPFNYIPVGETEGQGWDYDAWAAICDILGCTAEFVEAGWPAVLDQVAAGEIDTAADGISITDERKEILAFSDAYMVVEQKFIARLDDDRFADSDALIADTSAKIGTQVGTTNFDLAVELAGEDRVEAYQDFAVAVQALIDGDVDAVIIDDAAGLGYVGVNADQLVTLDGALQSDPLGFIFPLDSELVAHVNAALQQLKDDGTLEELGRKYFTDAFAITYDDIEEVGG